MPINDKRDPNSWYNSIPTRYQNEMPKPDKFTQTVLAMKEFDVDKLEDNEYTIGRGDIIAKIPKIEHRIYGRKAHKEYEGEYVDFVIGKYYDPESQQMRNKKVTIGTVSNFSGMMIINENYHKYFDKQGRLYNDPMAKEEEERRKLEEEEQEEKEAQERIEREEQIKREQEAQKEAEDAETTAGEDTASTAEEKKRQNLPDSTFKQPSSVTGGGCRNARKCLNLENETNGTCPQLSHEPTEEEMLEELKKEKAQMEAEKKEVEQLKKKLQASQKELDSIRMVRIIQFEEAQAKHIQLLREILHGQTEIIEKQAGKKPGAVMTLRQIRMINNLLSELREIFKGCESEEYLQLAEEPDPESQDDDNYGTTYGEMAILLQNYSYTLHAYDCGRLYYKAEE